MWQIRIGINNFAAIFMVGGATIGSALERSIDKAIEYHFSEGKFDNLREIRIVANHGENLSHRGE